MLQGRQLFGSSLPLLVRSRNGLLQCSPSMEPVFLTRCLTVTSRKNSAKDVTERPLMEEEKEAKNKPEPTSHGESLDLVSCS